MMLRTDTLLLRLLLLRLRCTCDIYTVVTNFLLEPHIMYYIWAKDKWGSETEGHKTDGEVDKMDSTNIKLRSIFVCRISCHLH